MVRAVVDGGVEEVDLVEGHRIVESRLIGHRRIVAGLAH
jgi:hypothetical protein